MRRVRVPAATRLPHPGEKKSLAQGLAPLTTESASRSPHSVQRNSRAQSGTGMPEPCCATCETPIRHLDLFIQIRLNSIREVFLQRTPSWGPSRSGRKSLRFHWNVVFLGIRKPRSTLAMSYFPPVGRSRKSWRKCAVSERAARYRMPPWPSNWPRSASNSTRRRQPPALSNHPIRSTSHPLRFLSRLATLQKRRDRNSDASFGSALSAVLPQAR